MKTFTEWLFENQITAQTAPLPLELNGVNIRLAALAKHLEDSIPNYTFQRLDNEHWLIKYHGVVHIGYIEVIEEREAMLSLRFYQLLREGDPSTSPLLQEAREAIRIWHVKRRALEEQETRPETEVGQNSALEIAKRALAILEQKAAGYTILTIPVDLRIELEDKRKEVTRLENS